VSGREQNTMKKENGLTKHYNRLRELVLDNFAIKICDKNFRGNAEVIVVSVKDTYHWISFEGESIEEALRRAINKLENPDEDYVDLDKQTWSATESSVFSSQHVRTFLKSEALK